MDTKSERLRDACELAVQTFKKLKKPEFDDIISKLEFCIGSYNFDKNPSGLVEYGFKALEMLKEIRKKFPKKVPAKLLDLAGRGSDLTVRQAIRKFPEVHSFMALKNILLCLIILVPAYILDAQQKFNPSTYIGINASASFCRVGFNPSVSQNMLSAVSAGLIVRHVSEPNIGTQLELNYAGRGWIENRDSLGTYRRNLEVLEIPGHSCFYRRK